jgi:hypothetical protein
MKYSKVIWGIILIIFGIMLVMKNMGILYFNWHAIFRFWPLLFIFWGISILPFKEYVKLILGLLTLVLAIYIFQRYEGHTLWHDNEYYDDTVNNLMEEQTLTEPYNTNVGSAVLKLDAAAGNFTIKGTTDELIVCKKKGNIGNYNMGIEKQGDSSKVIRIDMDTHVHIYHNKGNDVNIKLNPNPVWDMDFNIGAANADFDLTTCRTKSVKIDGGAASVNLTLGDKFYRTELKISTGASSITVHIPKTSGCELKSESFLVDKIIEGFKKNNNDTYSTENFNESSNKIYIKIDAAISSFKVIRY